MLNLCSQPCWRGKLGLCGAASTVSSPVQPFHHPLSNAPDTPSSGPRYHLLAHTVLTLAAVQDGFRTHDLTLASHGESVGVEEVAP